ncbi:MAG TPA: hypothetical protein H9852_08440 [Candidatus Mediterraneibacter colneyensis]|nr:hypothetical protein [Candidatus Mediterraneibacter colneyensis]
MLGKLIKYDLKAASKLFILLHGIYFLICVVSRFFYMDRLNFFRPDEPLVISLTLFVCLMTLLISALSIFTWLQIAFRFYQNLFSKEGYLSWTLPVSGPQHLWGKIISGYILMALDIIVISAGILLLVTGSNVTTAYSVIADQITQEMGISISSFSAILFAVCLISAVGSVIMIYFSVAVGQLFPSHRVLGAIAAYFITSFVIQVLSVILMIIFGCFPGYEFYAAQGSTMTDFLSGILTLSIALTLVITVIQYIATHYIMKKKINLI